MSAAFRHGVRQTLRLLALTVLAALALQVTFVARIAVMAWIDPGSTSFQRSEMWRLVRGPGPAAWAHRWVDADRMSAHLGRAVLAAEDAGFAEHSGVEWDAIERAWERNQREITRAERATPSEAAKRASTPARAEPKLVGGSTITQQLAKNLFLSGERTAWRKGQELLLTYALEGLLDKQRILEIYLNHVEWGEGVFGAQMAARHYHRVDASALTRTQAARLAVMLPAPRRFEKRPDSPYLRSRAAKVAASMGAVELP